MDTLYIALLGGLRIGLFIAGILLPVMILRRLTAKRKQYTIKNEPTSFIWLDGKWVARK